MKKVLLLCMPCHPLESPSIGISLLKAGLERDRVPCDVLYLNLAFAEFVCRVEPDISRALDLYDTYHRLGPDLFQLGNWIFAADLYGEREETGCCIEECLAGATQRWLEPWAATEDDLRTWSWAALQMCGRVTAFLDDALARIDCDAYDIVGFSCMYQQATASLGLARRVKARYPQKTIVFGGVNCEQEMGEALHRLFPFVDVVVSGKADWVFPELVRRLRGGDDLGSLPNLAFRRGAERCSTMRQPPLSAALDDLPYPDYSDYFSQLGQNLLAPLVRPSLPFESARGCWWGQRSHCTFCGFNGSDIAFATKSAVRALAEVKYLSERYPVRSLVAVDNILAMEHFQTFLPALAAAHLDLEIYLEVRANLTKAQVYLMKAAGVQAFQAGIESLSTSILRLMRKGCTALQNIQLLKWAREAGLRLDWNLLVGFPGEDPAEYAAMVQTVGALKHLQPPVSCDPVGLHRFSPYFHEREALGVCAVRPRAAYRCIYPFPEEDLAQLAYEFDFDYTDGRDPLAYALTLTEAVAAWQQNRDASLTYTGAGGALLIRDARGPETHWVRLRGAQAAVYEFCDEIHGVPVIEAHARQACEARSEAGASVPANAAPSGRDPEAGEPEGSGPGAPLAEPVSVTEPEGLKGGEYSRDELERLLAELVALRLMLCEDGRYLSLAICAPSGSAG